MSLQKASGHNCSTKGRILRLLNLFYFIFIYLFVSDTLVHS